MASSKRLTLNTPHEAVPLLASLLAEVLDLADREVAMRLSDDELARRRERIKAAAAEECASVGT